MKKAFLKRPLPYLLLSAAVLLALCCNESLKIRTYQFEEASLSGSLRIALLTDLHSSAYGKDMKKLVGALREADADLILIGGDLFDDRQIGNNTLSLLRQLPEGVPVYYVTGNHECRSTPELFAEEMAALRQYGVRRLEGEGLTLELNGVSFNLCGVDDASARNQPAIANDPSFPGFYGQLQRSAAIESNGLFTILLTHRPEQLNAYQKYGFDFVLAGHTHGGQWRIPGLLNGLYAPDQGLFPQYSGGFYQFNESGSKPLRMIVSRGLARHCYPVPRIFNRPELVLIDFN